MAERLKNHIQIGPKIIRAPMLHVCLCHKAREFAIHIRICGNRFHLGCPGLDLSDFYERLRHVVDHESLFGELLHQLDRSGQLLRVNKDVIGEAELTQ